MRGWMLAVVAGLIAAISVPAYLIGKHWPFSYHNVQPLLEKVLASQIKIDRYYCIYFPNPGFVADGLTLRRNSAPNLPPVGTARHLRVEGRWIDFLLLRKRVKLVEVDGLHVEIPPAGSWANKADFQPGSSQDFAGPSVVVEQFDVRDAELDLLRAEGGRYAFPIHRLLIGNLRKGETITYSLDMQNARPSGHIQAHGSFGPLTPNQLANTPVSGEFTFAPVMLGDIHGISGSLSAIGRFQGTLSDIEATADSTTPDFAVGHGQPTPVTAKMYVAVNGLNGDVLVRGIDAQTGRTTVHAQGEIVGSPAVTNLDLRVSTGRAQDILRPFLHGDVPVAGPVTLHSHAYVAPAEHKQTFLERLRMDGNFDIPSEQITNHNTERKLSAFSLRAQGKGSPGDDQPLADVLSQINGAVTVRNGIAYAHRLRFLVPGASLDLNGTFSFRNQNARLFGDLRMQTDISHATTGFKSVLLKPLAPFFKKGTSGATVPIAITGFPKNYKISENIMHQK